MGSQKALSFSKFSHKKLGFRDILAFLSVQHCKAPEYSFVIVKDSHIDSLVLECSSREACFFSYSEEGATYSLSIRLLASNHPI